MKTLYLKLRKGGSRFIRLSLMCIHCFIFRIKKKDTNYTKSPDNQKTLLIVLYSGIGDYFFSRNFLPYIRKSNKYKDYKIVLAVTASCAIIAKEYDNTYFDELSIAHNLNIDFSVKQRQALYEQLNSINPDIIILPRADRVLSTDVVFHAVNASQKIATDYSYAHNFKLASQYANRYFFNSIIHPTTSSFFEFDILKNIFEQIIEEPIPIEKAVFRANKHPIGTTLPEKYAAIFIDSNSTLRKWSAKNYTTAVNYINHKHNIPVIILGQDLSTGECIMANSSSSNINLCQSTSIPELISILVGAELVISNDTGAMHIASMAEVRTICISNGNHFGRFTNYDKSKYPNHITILPETLYKHINNPKLLHDKFKTASYLDINTISIERVFEAIDVFMKKL